MGGYAGWCNRVHVEARTALKCWKHWREIEWPALRTPSRDRKIYRLAARAMPTGPRLEFLIDGLRPDTGFGTRVIAPFQELTYEEIRGMPREAFLWTAPLLTIGGDSTDG